MIEYEPGGPIKDCSSGINLTPIKPLKLQRSLNCDQYFLVVFSSNHLIGPSFRETSSKLTKSFKSLLPS